MIGRLNHVAIVVPDLESASSLYRNTLGAAVSAPMERRIRISPSFSHYEIDLPKTLLKL